MSITPPVVNQIFDFLRTLGNHAQYFLLDLLFNWHALTQEGSFIQNVLYLVHFKLTAAIYIHEKKDRFNLNVRDLRIGACSVV